MEENLGQTIIPKKIQPLSSSKTNSTVSRVVLSATAPTSYQFSLQRDNNSTLTNRLDYGVPVYLTVEKPESCLTGHISSLEEEIIINFIK